MGGRFGKYGDIKRKARIRRSRISSQKFDRLKYKLKRLEKEKRIKLQSKSKLKVTIEINPNSP